MWIFKSVLGVILPDPHWHAPSSDPTPLGVCNCFQCVNIYLFSWGQRNSPLDPTGSGASSYRRRGGRDPLRGSSPWKLQNRERGEQGIGRKREERNWEGKALDLDPGRSVQPSSAHNAYPQWGFEPMALCWCCFLKDNNIIVDKCSKLQIFILYEFMAYWALEESIK